VVADITVEGIVYVSYWNRLAFLMSRESKLAGMVFEKNLGGKDREISLTAKKLEVLTALDGTRNVAEISAALNMRIIDLGKILTSLYKQDLIVKKKQTDVFVEKSFMNEMERRLGPITTIVMQDIARQMGADVERFPITHLPEYIEELSKKIPVAEKKREFIQSMLSKL